MFVCVSKERIRKEAHEVGGITCVFALIRTCTGLPSSVSAFINDVCVDKPCVNVNKQYMNALKFDVNVSFPTTHAHNTKRRCFSFWSMRVFIYVRGYLPNVCALVYNKGVRTTHSKVRYTSALGSFKKVTFLSPPK
jgi:hypothetical protein